MYKIREGVVLMPAKKERDIKDMDRVYDNPSAVCKLICSYILSKGDLKTKFIPIESKIPPRP